MIIFTKMHVWFHGQLTQKTLNGFKPAYLRTAFSALKIPCELVVQGSSRDTTSEFSSTIFPEFSVKTLPDEVKTKRPFGDENLAKALLTSLT